MRRFAAALLVGAAGCVSEPTLSCDLAIAPGPSHAERVVVAEAVRADGLFGVVARLTVDPGGVLHEARLRDGPAATHTATVALEPGRSVLVWELRERGERVCRATASVTVARDASLALSLPDGDVVRAGDDLAFVARVRRAREVRWSSDRAGDLGATGVVDGRARLEVALPPGEHVVVAEVDGVEGPVTAAVRVRVDSPPSPPEVVVELPAHAGSDLRARVVTPAVDPDQDEVRLVWSWALAGVIVPDLTGPEVPAARLARDQSWEVTAIPVDALGAGPAATARVVVGNAPPVVTEGIIFPLHSDGTVPLTCQAAYADADGDLVEATLTWTVEGHLAGHDAVLDVGRFERGDVVSCWATVSDGRGLFGPLLVSSHQVGGGAPFLERVTIRPDAPRAGELATCAGVGLFDPSGGEAVVTYAWSLDGVPLGTGSSVRVPDGATGRLACEATPISDTLAGDPLTTWRPVRPDLTPGNILVVVLDDIGVDRIGAYGVGVDLPETPTLDALAAEGVRFERAWGAPTCSPTRSMIATGRYPYQTGIGSAIESDDGSALALEEVTFPELIRLEGLVPYSTAAIGKWHLGTIETGHDQAILDQGWDRYRGQPGNLGPRASVDGTRQTYFDYEYVADGVVTRRSTYATTVEADDAIAAIHELEEPWLVHLGFHASHSPAHVPPDGLYSGGPLVRPPQWQKYRAMTEAMDTELARVIAEVPPDTTIFVIGDNGTAQGATRGPYPASEAKMSMYEGGVRIPILVAGPMVRTPGTVSRALVSATDLYVTLADLAGVPMPSPHVEAHTEAHSLVPFLLEPELPSLRDVLYTERFLPDLVYGPYTQHKRGVRDERWKLIWDQTAGYTFFDVGDAWTDGAPLDVDALSPHARVGFERLRAILEGPRFRR